MNENKEKMEKDEKIQAGQNTAHVAGRVAARYAGGEVGGKVYDALSKTKVGQAVERGVGKRIANSPVGDINKSLNDSGAVDLANKGVDVMSGQKPKGGVNSLGSNGTANNLRNKFNTMPQNNNSNQGEMNSNTPNSLKKTSNPSSNRKKSVSSEEQKKEEKENDDNKDEKQDDEEKNNGEDSEEQQETKSKKLLKKLILKAIIFIAPVLIGLLIFLAIFAPLFSAYSWFISLFHNKDADTIDYAIYSEKETEDRQAEIDFNDAILGSKDGNVKGIVAEYQEKYGVTIDWYLLEALITYRYTGVSGDAYTEDDSVEIDEEEIKQNLESLEIQSETDNEEDSEDENDDNKVDYTAAKKKIEAFASLMVVKEDNIYKTDKEKNGIVYNNVLNSKTFKDYYKPLLADDTEESRKKLLDTIYDYAEGAKELLEENDTPSNAGVVSETIQVYLQTCVQPYQKVKINDIEVWNNPSSTGDYPKSVNLKDYLKGVVYGEIGDHLTEEYKEAIKAQMIAALTFAVKHKESGFTLKNGSMYMPAGDCKQLCCDPNNGCTYMMTGKYGTSYTGPKRFHGYVFTRDPMPSETSSLLDTILDEIFGIVMVEKGVTAANFEGPTSIPSNAGNYRDSCTLGTCFSQQQSFSDAKAGMTYEQILRKHYSRVGLSGGNQGFDLINIKEGLYFTSTGSYAGTVTLNENYHYHQGDSPWESQNLCDSGSIRSNGCNITSAAIAISLLTNSKVTPETLNNRQNEISTCTQSTRPQMIMDFAKLYGLTATEVKKNNPAGLNNLLSQLATGKYVAVARLTSGSERSFYPSGNGHYMAIVGVRNENGKNEVLVWDPGYRDSDRDNRWVDINDLVTILRLDYSFILIGK